MKSVESLNIHVVCLKQPEKRVETIFMDFITFFESPSEELKIECPFTKEHIIVNLTRLPEFCQQIDITR